MSSFKARMATIQGSSFGTTGSGLAGRNASERTDLNEARADAYRYLENAAASTGVDLPGVVPTAWPITRFEQSFALYAVLIGGFLLRVVLVLSSESV